MQGCFHPSRVVMLVLSVLALGFSSESFVKAGEPSRAGVEQDAVVQQNWHQWRGPLANGTAPAAKPPVTWGANQNIKWKAAIAGTSNATPIVWGDRVFVVSAEDTGRVDPKSPAPEDQPERMFGIVFPNTFFKFQVYCLNRHTGEVVWQETAAELVPHEGVHPHNTHASASPITDGERLYVWLGSPGLFCYDLDGKLLWKRDLGKVSTRLSFGEGGSPALFDNRLVIVRDQEEQSYIVAIDALTGKTLWEQERDEPSTWATPVVVADKSRAQVITNGSKRVRSYDLATGNLIWECGGQVANVTPSPVVLGNLVCCMSGYRGSSAMGIPLDKTGDLTDSDSIQWTLSRDTPYVPSPLLYENQLYFNKSNNAVLTSVDMVTGKVLYGPQRINGVSGIYASPVAANGHIYLVGRDGSTAVIKHGKTFEQVATNQLDDPMDASPAIAGSQIFLRSKTHVYCIEQQ